MRRYSVFVSFLVLAFFVPKLARAACVATTDQQKVDQANVVAIGQYQHNDGSTYTFRIVKVYKGDEFTSAAYVYQPSSGVNTSETLSWSPNSFYLLYLSSSGQAFYTTNACMGTRLFTGTFTATEQAIFGTPPVDAATLGCTTLSTTAALEQSDVVVHAKADSAQVTPANPDAPLVQRTYDQTTRLTTGFIYKGDTSLREVNVLKKDYLHSFAPFSLEQGKEYLLFLKSAGTQPATGNKVYTMLVCAGSRLISGPLTADEAVVLNPLAKVPVAPPPSNVGATPFTIEDFGYNTCGPGPGSPKEPEGWPWVVGLLVIGTIVWPWRSAGLPLEIVRRYRRIGWIVAGSAVGLAIAVVLNMMFVNGWNAATSISVVLNALFQIPTTYACLGYNDVTLTAFNLLSWAAFVLYIPSMIATMIERRRLSAKMRAPATPAKEVHSKLSFAVTQAVIALAIVVAFAVITYFNLNR